MKRVAVLVVLLQSCAVTGDRTVVRELDDGAYALARDATVLLSPVLLPSGETVLVSVGKITWDQFRLSVDSPVFATGGLSAPAVVSWVEADDYASWAGARLLDAGTWDAIAAHGKLSPWQAPIGSLHYRTVHCVGPDTVVELCSTSATMSVGAIRELFSPPMEWCAGRVREIAPVRGGRAMYRGREQVFDTDLVRNIGRSAGFRIIVPRR